MNIGSVLLRTYCLFLFTFEKNLTKKSDFGPDEFKVIREIILTHPRLQKKRKIGQMACVIAAFIMGLFALGTFLDRFILDCFIEYTLIFLAFAIFFIWFAKVGIYLE